MPKENSNLSAQSAPETKIHWHLTADRKPYNNQVVAVHGGIAMYTDGLFYSGNADPVFRRVIQWEVTHWARIEDITPPAVLAAGGAK